MHHWPQFGVGENAKTVLADHHIVKHGRLDQHPMVHNRLRRAHLHSSVHHLAPVDWRASWPLVNLPILADHDVGPLFH